MQIDKEVIENRLLPGIIFIALGICSIIMRTSGAKSAVKWNLRILGYAGKEQTYRIFSLLGGIAFIIFGILDLLGVIQFRQ